MITVTTKPAPAAPSNYSGDELIRHIEHHFPDLDGSLKELLNRFDRATYRNTFPRVPEIHGEAKNGDTFVVCPNCKTKLELDFSEPNKEG